MDTEDYHESVPVEGCVATKLSFARLKTILRKKTAKRQRNRTLEYQKSLQKATKRFCKEQTRKN